MSLKWKTSKHLQRHQIKFRQLPSNIISFEFQDNLLSLYLYICTGILNVVGCGASLSPFLFIGRIVIGLIGELKFKIWHAMGLLFYLCASTISLKFYNNSDSRTTIYIHVCYNKYWNVTLPIFENTEKWNQ